MQAPAERTALPPQARDLVLALLLVAAATGLSLAIDPWVTLTSQAMVYLLAVVLAAFRLRAPAPALCALASAMAMNFFLVPPRGTFAVDGPANLVALVALLVVALAIGRLSTHLRAETALARQGEARADALQALATDLARADSPDPVMARGLSALEATWPGRHQLVWRDASGTLQGRPDPEDAAADGLRRCIADGLPMGPGTGHWPGLAHWLLPLRSDEGLEGAMLVDGARDRDASDRDHAQRLGALLAQALMRLRWQASVRDARQRAEQQQAQGTFLASIAHDLRTPLAGIVGAASALQAQGSRLGEAERERLLAGIRDQARHLSELTENTLRLVELTQSGHAPDRDWQSVEEIVGSALARARVRAPTRRLRAAVEPGLPLVRGDAVLLAQLLDNLLDNALKYSAAPVRVAARLREGAIELSVRDRGEAIPQALHARIFEPYVRGPDRGVRGSGLGLALCRAIAQLHDAPLTLHARPGAGNRFVLRLPVAWPQPVGEGSS